MSDTEPGGRADVPIPEVPEIPSGPGTEIVEDIRGWLEAGEHISDVLRRFGVPEADIAQAEADDIMSLFAVERLLLPDPPRYDLAGIAEQAGVDAALVLGFWRSLGFPDPPPGEQLFTETDLAILRAVLKLLDTAVIEPELAVQMTRVIGSSLARVAQSQIESFGISDVRTDPEREAEFFIAAGSLLPIMPGVLDYVWRRHLQAALRTAIMRSATGVDPGETVVGFADLVGFTALSQQLPPEELAGIVDRFEALAYDTVAAQGGRVVKMIGDEVMFSADDSLGAAKIALGLTTVCRDDDSLPDLRVGLAAGEVVEREGDLFGPVVNMASRLVGVARPSQVIVADELHRELADVDGADFAWKPLKPRRLKGIGSVRVWILRTAGEERSRGRR